MGRLAQMAPQQSHTILLFREHWRPVLYRRFLDFVLHLEQNSLGVIVLKINWIATSFHPGL
jgi:hypothetical protein